MKTIISFIVAFVLLQSIPVCAYADDREHHEDSHPAPPPATSQPTSAPSANPTQKGWRISPPPPPPASAAPLTWTDEDNKGLKALNNDIKEGRQTIIGLTYAGFYNGVPNVSLSIYKSPTTAIEFDMGGRIENIQSAGQQRMINLDLLVVGHQALNNFVGFYYGYGLSGLQTEYSTDNWHTSWILSSNITIGYALGVELFIMNNFYIKAGYRSGAAEAGIEGLFF